MILAKDDYLRVKVVEEFLKFLRGYVHDNNHFKHDYRDRRRGFSWHCDSVFGAFQNYSYPLLNQFREPSNEDYRSFSANALVLNQLSEELRKAYDSTSTSNALEQVANEEKLLQASQKVFVWGGVAGRKEKKPNKPIGNYLWIAETFPRGKGLREAYEKAHSIFCSDRPNLGEVGKDGPRKVRSNAGFTKVYSLLFDDFIIYDSRVAAALGLFVVKFCRESGYTSVPAELNFGWMPPQESKNTKSPKQRDATVANSSYIFDRASSEAEHAWSNIRANWIFSNLFESCTDTSLFASLPSKQARLRALESAFFMIGYDLGGHEWLSDQPGSRVMIPDNLVQLTTIAKNEPFHYRRVPSGFIFVVGKSRSKLFLPESFVDELITDYSDQELTIGCSRDNPPQNSLGAMLMDKVSPTAMASYVAPLLVHLRLASEGPNTRTIRVLGA